MISITVTDRSAAVHLGRLAKKFDPVIRRDMKKAEKQTKSMGRDVVLNMVYSRPENPRMPRSMNLALSVDADSPEDSKRPSMYIFNNPLLATRPFPWVAKKSIRSDWPDGLKAYSEKPYKYYPGYVAEGNFFGRHVADDLDFYSGWLKTVAPWLARRIFMTIQHEIGRA